MSPLGGLGGSLVPSVFDGAGRSWLFCAPVPALRVFESVHAVEPAGRLFPESRHRSKRVLKKLIRRHGGEFIMKPCSYMMGDTLVAHPSIANELRKEISASHWVV